MVIHMAGPSRVQGVEGLDMRQIALVGRYDRHAQVSFQEFAFTVAVSDHAKGCAARQNAQS